MNTFSYEIIKNSNVNHYGKLKFHNKVEIETPVCWFGLSIIESKEYHLEVFKKSKIEAFLSNAYDLYYTDKKQERKCLISKLHGLNLCHKMDSGGFQLMKANIKGQANKFPLTPKMVLDKQIETGCECAVQLDFPFGPNITDLEKRKRLDKTIENLEEILKLIDQYGVEITILPVIHTVSDDHNLLNYGLERLEDILGTKPKLIGIGSLVPLVKTIKGSKKNGIESFLYALISLRKMLPHSFIHAFGIGGTMAYLAILAGIDSYDSNGWIQKTGFGVVQLPGISDRFLQREPHNRPYLIKNRKLRNNNEIINEVEIFMNCQCEACKPFYNEKLVDKGWGQKKEAFSGRSPRAKLLRGIHNVSLYQNELLNLREAIKRDNLANLIKRRLRNGIYYKYINFIKNLKSQSIEDLASFQNLLNSKNTKIENFI